MPSSLTWVDHDAKARERSLQILELFKEKESRDELGLGGIRDSFADQLFPGTSTIQTRLRYMLFVPWIYISLERQRLKGEKFAREADRRERELIRTLQAAKDNFGVIGAVAGTGLKRLPSSIYWGGLGSWGIRLQNLSQEEYHLDIEIIYQRQEKQEQENRQRRQRGEEFALGNYTWHPHLPQAPKNFPKEADFRLTPEEANFLLECLRRHHPDSLLAFLAWHCSPVEVEFPWEHPDFASFRPHHQELLHHARWFSQTMYGATLLYNLLLSEIRNWEEKIADYRTKIQAWQRELDFHDFSRWSLERLWELTLDKGHTITYATRRFVSAWVTLVSAEHGNIADNQRARDLVTQREQSLKGTRSRIRNRRALEQWGGASGVRRLSFRWPNAKIYLKDLWQGIKGETDARSQST